MNKYVIFQILCSLFFLSSCTNNKEFIKIQGETQGTYYAIVYNNTIHTNIQHQIDSVLHQFDLQYSNYIANSVISKINSNDTSVYINKDFEYFWNTSVTIWKLTEGDFDISISPIINAWNFGYTKSTTIPSKKEIDNLLTYKGMNTMYISNHRFIKSKPQMKIIGNAIAQGYAVDKVCKFLDSLKISNYLVDIGGEMKVKGRNPQGKKWNIGITKPQEQIDTVQIQDSYLLTIPLSNKALATSGNYRKFYKKDGKKYSHIISPISGYPVTNNLLSATVIGEHCIEVDAIATACMVMGFEKSKLFFDKNTQYDAVLLYSKNDSIQIYKTKNIE